MGRSCKRSASSSVESLPIRLAPRGQLSHLRRT
jgi:hypothetical protein